MKRIHCLFPLLAFACLFPVSAQTVVPIARIQGTADKSPYDGQEVLTQGVVTLTLYGEGRLNGFFMQDTVAAGEPASTGIFVYGKADVREGDFVRLRAKAGEYRQRTQLSGIKELEVLRRNMPVSYLTVDFPRHLSSPADFERHEGMALRIPHKMYLVSTYDLLSNASVELSSKRLRSPTDYNLPGSDAYRAVADSNRVDRLVLDDGGNTRNPQDNPWLDEDGTCRTGQVVDSLLFVVDQVDDKYRVYAVHKPVFYGNERTTAPDESALGDYELKVCGFNLERYYDKDPLQRTRIVHALAAIDADMFGLVEVGGGKKVIDSLVAALNRAKGGNEYTYLPWQGHEAVSDYTLNHIVYRPSKVEPYDQYFLINNVGPRNRKLIQAFREREHGNSFIFSINHFKAKSGTGTGADADRGDGQGVFNNQRLQEAYALKDRLSSLKFYYNTDNVLIMGDLNALYLEDPIRVLTDAGYRNQTNRFGDDYSYCFDGQVQYLDYSLASAELEEFVTGAVVWHINSDEPSFLDYDRDPERHTGPYRCSDHEPVIVGLKFKDLAGCQSFVEAGIRIWPNPARDFVHLRADRQGMVQVFTLGGVEAVRMRIGEGDNTLSLQGLVPGLYLLRVTDDRGVSRVGKLSVG